MIHKRKKLQQLSIGGQLKKVKDVKEKQKIPVAIVGNIGNTL